MAAAVNRPATGHPLTSHTTTPAARANSTRLRADRSVLALVPNPAARMPGPSLRRTRLRAAATSAVSDRLGSMLP